MKIFSREGFATLDFVAAWLGEEDVGEAMQRNRRKDVKQEALESSVIIMIALMSFLIFDCKAGCCASA